MRLVYSTGLFSKMSPEQVGIRYTRINAERIHEGHRVISIMVKNSNRLPFFMGTNEEGEGTGA